MLWGVALADEPVYDLDIASMNAAHALNRFAEQTGAITLFPYDLACSRRANAVRGRYTLLQGLHLLLRGTGLSGGLSDDRVVSISHVGNAQRGAEEGAVLTQKTSLGTKIAAFVTSILRGSATRNTGGGRLQGAMLVASVTCLGGQAVAQNDPSQEMVAEVLVSGKRIEQSLPQDLADYGNRVQVIEAEELEKRGIIDVGQALQQLAPSLYIQSKSGPFDYVDVSLQGSRTNEILWLVDGVRVTNRLYNGTTPLDTIPASMVERIEVLEGGQGLFYGTQSVAGVINIITKSFSRETDGQLALGFDTNDGRHVSGYARSAVGMHEFVFYASSDEADGFQPIRSEDYQPSATDRKRGYDVQTLGAKYGVDIGDDVRLSGGYQYTDAQLDYGAPARVANYYNKREEGIANVKLDWQASDNLGLFVKAYHHEWNSHVFRNENSLTTPGTLVRVRDNVYWGYKDFGVNALAKFVPVANGIEYYLGYDFQNYNGRDESLRIADQTESVHAVFGQVRATITDNFKLAGGARYNVPKNGGNISVWNVSANYDITDNLFTRASVGTAYRLPDAEQLFGIDPCCTQGNPDLTGEKSSNLNLSIGGFFDVATRHIRWELVGFARKLEDLIGDVDDGSGELIYGNTDARTEVTGWLVTFNVPVHEDFSADLSYSATEATRDDSNLQIDRVPEEIAKVLLDYHPAALPIGASLSWSYVGDTYQVLPGGLGRVNRGTSSVADLSGFLEFGKEGRHRLTGRIQNVTDEVYTTRLERFRTDVDNVSFAGRSVGVPRTYSLIYAYSF